MQYKINSTVNLLVQNTTEIARSTTTIGTIDKGLHNRKQIFNHNYKIYYFFNCKILRYL